MNIVAVKLDQESANKRSNNMVYGIYASLKRRLSQLGKIIIDDPGGFSMCFLIANPGLLSALWKSAEMSPGISIQVFSLSPPEEQLLGTIDKLTAGDPDAYALK